MFQGTKCRRTAGEVLGDHADVHSMKTLLTRTEHSPPFLFNVQVGPGNHSSKSNSILNLRSQSLQNCLVTSTEIQRRKHVSTHNYSQINYTYCIYYTYIHHINLIHCITSHMTHTEHQMPKINISIIKRSISLILSATYLNEYQQNSPICAMHLLDLLLH